MRPIVVAMVGWVVAVAASAALPAHQALSLLIEGGLVEGASALVAGIAASVALWRLVVAQRSGALDGVTVRRGVVLAAAGVFCAGEELSWGEGMVWKAATTKRDERIDAAHDVLNLLSARITAPVVAVAVVCVAVIGLLVMWRLTRRVGLALAWRRALAAGAMLMVPVVIDVLHKNSVVMMAIEEWGELCVMGVLVAAAHAVHVDKGAESR
jgi:hypothetical protein